MKRISDIAVRGIVALGPRFLPVADVGSRELPLELEDVVELMLQVVVAIRGLEV